MNKDRHHLLWIMLPAVVVAGYFVVFQPGQNEPSVFTIQDDTVASPSPIAQPETDKVAGVTNEALVTPADLGRGQEEVARDRAFINYAFPVLSTWNLQDVKPLLAEETIAASSDEELNEVMSVLEDRLGELKSFETPQPVTLENALPNAEEAEGGELQHYQFVAYYEAGEAEIDLILHKHQNESSLYSFNIHVQNQEENVL